MIAGGRRIGQVEIHRVLEMVMPFDRRTFFPHTADEDWAPHRSWLEPDVPAMSETIPGFEATVWLGIAASPKTPREIVNRLNAEIRAFLVNQKKYWGDFVQRAKIPLSD